MRMNGGHAVLESLIREGVEYVWGYPGGANLPLYDALPDYHPRLKHILVRHEQAAAHAADAYARVTGRVGVCFGTSGPGATNLTTGIANAWMESVPLVAITGQVVTGLIGRDGFQEADITGITLPVTKHSRLVLRADDIPVAIKEAFHIARTGRPGPVLVDIPRDVLQQFIEFDYPKTVRLRGYRPPGAGDPALVQHAADLIAESQKPLILAGHGILLSRAWDELRELSERCHIPVISTLLGLGSFPGDHPLYLGMPGMHGMYWNNIAMTKADLLIAIGMRFDDRVTGRLRDFATQAKKIHIDIDPAELEKNVPTAAPIAGDVKTVLRQLLEIVQPARHEEWVTWIEEFRAEHPSIAIPETEKLLPQTVIKAICDTVGGDGYVVTGVGQHQMWAAQYYWNTKPGHFVTSGGLGTMGYEVPAAVGTQFGAPNSQVWAVCGDGGFQMTQYELATVAENQLPIKFAIINNSYLGMVRQWQELFYKNNLVAVKMFSPDFVKLAEAYGILGLRVTDKAQVDGAIDYANKHAGPVLIDFRVDESENVYPMVPPGAALFETIDQPPVPQPTRVTVQA